MKTIRLRLIVDDQTRLLMDLCLMFHHRRQKKIMIVNKKEKFGVRMLNCKMIRNDGEVHGRSKNRNEPCSQNTKTRRH